MSAHIPKNDFLNVSAIFYVFTVFCFRNALMNVLFLTLYYDLEVHLEPKYQWQK